MSPSYSGDLYTYIYNCYTAHHTASPAIAPIIYSNSARILVPVMALTMLGLPLLLLMLLDAVLLYMVVVWARGTAQH